MKENRLWFWGISDDFVVHFVRFLVDMASFSSIVFFINAHVSVPFWTIDQWFWEGSRFLMILYLIYGFYYWLVIFLKTAITCVIIGSRYFIYNALLRTLHSISVCGYPAQFRFLRLAITRSVLSSLTVNPAVSTCEFSFRTFYRLWIIP